MHEVDHAPEQEKGSSKNNSRRITSNEVRPISFLSLLYVNAHGLSAMRSLMLRDPLNNDECHPA